MADVFRRRQFLNTEEHGGSAHIEAYVNEAKADPGVMARCDAEFSIADCSRKVTLDFSTWGAASVENSRAKVRRLKRAIIAFEAALEAQLKVVEGK